VPRLVDGAWKRCDVQIMRSRRIRRAALAASVVGLLVAALTGCGRLRGEEAPSSGSVASIPVGKSEQSLAIDGTTRTFHLYRPAELASPAALVVMLHGGFGSGTQAEQSYGWDAEADAGHFLVVYPDGLNRAWNTGGGCCGRPATDDVDDVGFITAMVAGIEGQTPIDRHRIYATGISNGGIMSYTLACRTTLFAAIGPDSATQLGPCVTPAPLSVIHIHGTADTRIPYDGGRGQGVAHIDGPAIPALNATWRTIDACRAPTMTTAGPVTTSVAQCPSGRTVELVTISGAGHQWPGGRPGSAIQKLLGADPPSTALNATSMIWQFFAAHPG
jgi:polyhydroxybutyrate depolymerase